MSTTHPLRHSGHASNRSSMAKKVFAVLGTATLSSAQQMGSLGRPKGALEKMTTKQLSQVEQQWDQLRRRHDSTTMPAQAEQQQRKTWTYPWDPIKEWDFNGEDPYKSVLADAGKEYDKWQQAYRMLGGYIDCDHPKASDEDSDSKDDDNMQNSTVCSRWMMWAAYVDPAYQGGEYNEYYGNDSYNFLDCGEEGSNWKLLGVYRQEFYQFLEQISKHLWAVDDARYIASLAGLAYMTDSDCSYVGTSTISYETSEDSSSYGNSSAYSNSSSYGNSSNYTSYSWTYITTKTYPLYAGIQPLEGGDFQMGLYTDASCTQLDYRSGLTYDHFNLTTDMDIGSGDFGDDDAMDDDIYNSTSDHAAIDYYEYYTSYFENDYNFRRRLNSSNYTYYDSNYTYYDDNDYNDTNSTYTAYQIDDDTTDQYYEETDDGYVDDFYIDYTVRSENNAEQLWKATQEYSLSIMNRVYDEFRSCHLCMDYPSYQDGYLIGDYGTDDDDLINQCWKFYSHNNFPCEGDCISLGAAQGTINSVSYSGDSSFGSNNYNRGSGGGKRKRSTSYVQAQAERDLLLANMFVLMSVLVFLASCMGYYFRGGCQSYLVNDLLERPPLCGDYDPDDEFTSESELETDPWYSQASKTLSVKGQKNFKSTMPRRHRKSRTRVQDPMSESDENDKTEDLLNPPRGPQEMETMIETSDESPSDASNAGWTSPNQASGYTSPEGYTSPNQASGYTSPNQNSVGSSPNRTSGWESQTDSQNETSGWSSANEAYYSPPTYEYK